MAIAMLSMRQQMFASYNINENVPFFIIIHICLVVPAMELRKA